MTRMIFVNLPVTDLKKAVAFYEAVGATNNPQFTDDTAACMVFSDSIHVMLLTHEKFAQFSPKPIADARTSAQAILCLSADSRADVDAITEKAGSAGGKIDLNEADDYGWMYGRSFEDLDGHMWAINWMDLAAFAAATSGQTQAA